jgi:lipopolysaccharide/colanic/teichoic acid biosynthesis glycosyltransferase
VNGYYVPANSASPDRSTVALFEPQTEDVADHVVITLTDVRVAPERAPSVVIDLRDDAHVVVGDSPYHRVGKPVMDRVLAAALMTAFAPVMGGVAILVRRRLGRGVLYKQERIGHLGRPFVMYKFRTMHEDRRRVDLGPPGVERRHSHKVADDPRHTQLGRVLRRLSIDELPQLWNVLRGDMSLVGPRPELRHVVEEKNLHDHPRHLVKPGITGPWQISDLRGALLHEHMELDIEYVKDVSFRKDVRILLATAHAVCGRRLGR